MEAEGDRLESDRRSNHVPNAGRPAVSHDGGPAPGVPILGVGVGDSVRFFRKPSDALGYLRRLVGSRGTYVPDELVAGRAPSAADQAYGIRGVHIYTVNEVPDTESWRRAKLAG